MGRREGNWPRQCLEVVSRPVELMGSGQSRRKRWFCGGGNEAHGVREQGPAVRESRPTTQPRAIPPVPMFRNIGMRRGARRFDRIFPGRAVQAGIPRIPAAHGSFDSHALGSYAAGYGIVGALV